MKHKLENVLCLYHADCLDGFGAAWVVWYYCQLNDIPCELRAMRYGEELDEELAPGKDLVIVDYSLPVVNMVLESLYAKTVTWIDHHKSAIDKWELVTTNGCYIPRERGYLDTPEVHYDFMAKCEFILNTNHSGCILAWRHFFPAFDAPPLLRTIQDGDLWLFKLQHTKEITLGLSAQPFDFKRWKDYIAPNDLYTAGEAAHRLRLDGSAIDTWKMKLIHEALKEDVHMVSIAGHVVPALNLPAQCASVAGNLLLQAAEGCEQPLFSATYRDVGEKRYFSLRSANNLTDVSEVAEFFGGGGHRNAAGFEVPMAAIAFRNEAWANGVHVFSVGD